VHLVRRTTARETKDTDSHVRRCALLAAALAVAVVVTGAAQAADPSLELAVRYAPVVRLVQQTEPCKHGEAYVPTDVNLVLASPEVVLRGPWDRTNVIKVAPSAADLSSGLFDYHLDFPGSAVAPGCTYDEWSHRINNGHAPTMYAHVVSERAHPGQLALQYWFFYVFNNFNDKHEGDWEMIQLDFDAATPAQALERKPAMVGFSQHEGAESAHWGDSKVQIVDGTHPVVYPALGSHANYYTSALHLGRSAAQGVGCDDTTGPSTEFRPEVALIPTGRAGYLSAYPWLGYEGHWGEEHEGFYNGPTGPNTKPQWTEPITWATTAWHDNSFSLPAGGSIGVTATGFFCGAIAAGSSVLTALVHSPSPVYLALALLFVLILWLTSRTQWHPSAPLHLERRRRWGAIVAASRRMYFGHLPVFLGVGLLFIPLGLLITGVQYLLFRVGNFNGLVNSAGSTNAVVDFLALALGIVITLFGLAVVNAATAVVMLDIDAGRKASARAAYRKVLPKIGPLLGVTLLAAVFLALVSFTSIGVFLAIWLVVRWAFLAQAVVLDDASGLSCLRRSSHLVRGNWWRAASLLFFVTVIALLLGPLIGMLLLFVTSASFNFINLISSVVFVFVLPYAAVASTYMYFDLRVARRRDEEAVEAAGDVLPAEVAS
jgi:hypothetical protein